MKAMLNKINWKKTLKTIAFVGVSLFLLGFAHTLRRDETIKDVIITIEEDSLHQFITVKDVKQLLNDNGFATQNEKVKDINLHRLETLLMTHSGVKKIDAFCTLEGQLYIQIKQRKPLMRVFDVSGSSFYIDDEGTWMPLSMSYTARVPVASGEIKENFFGSAQSISQIESNDSLRKVFVVDDLFTIASAIQKDDFLKAYISQMYVYPNGEIALIPILGVDEIIIGKTDRLNEKLDNLKIFCENKLAAAGLNTYKSLNLKFKNQVVAQRKSATTIQENQTPTHLNTH